MTSNDSANDSATRDEQAKPRYWRSLSELHQREEFQDYLQREFPVAASEFPEGVSRRKWLQLMGASFAIAGVAGCRYPEETIEPFVIRPEGRMPGETYSRATNFELADRVYSLLVTCFDGRPLKIEANTDHPTGGGTDAYAQASVLGLYDPDRARGDEGFLLRLGEKNRRLEVGWDQFQPYGTAMIKAAASNDQGAKFAVLMPPTRSPSIVRMLKALKGKLPKATIARYDNVNGDAMRQATSGLFGKPAKQVLDLEQADIIVTLQADVLGQDASMLHNAKGFAKRRDPDPDDAEMNRLYVVEGGFTLTGAAADSRLALRPSQMAAFLGELGRRVTAQRETETPEPDEESKAYDELSPDQRLERFLDVLARDVAKAGEKAVIVVGDHLGPDVIAAGVQMNKQLGSFGTLQRFVAEPDGDLGETVSIAELTTKIGNGEVDSLLILGGNPVATAPGDVKFLDALGKVEQSVYLGEYDDETGAACDWSLPLAHPLESWGDCVDAYGHYGVCQPQILPLLGGRAVVEVLAMMLAEAETDGAKIVRRTADQVAGKSLSERQWRKLLHDGYAADVQVKSEELSPAGEAKALPAESPVAAPDLQSESFRDNIEVLFTAADGIYDGRFANNGWLQEMPQALTKLAWDNAALVSPATAKAMGLKHGLKITLRNADASIELPVYEMPGCAAGVVTVTMGYGRQRVGMVGGMPDEDVDVVGVDVSPLRTTAAMLTATVEARPKFDEYELSTTQDHWAIDELGRLETSNRSYNLVREGTTQLLEKVPEFANAQPKEPHVPHIGKGDSPGGSPWQEPVDAIEKENAEKGSPTPQWGMSIDLGKCTGCNACVIACQSENNVPIVGREQVMNSREMHWLRIDRYFQGDEENAEIVQEPMACQHCETAPCEQVCPVAATIHTNEGINAMAYNRCIGTRYCANNCPFKVRRFNYFNYNEDVGVGYGVKAYPGAIESANRKLQALVLNPDVTVRGRGVMEKCTYCVQRVENAKIEARKRDGKWEIRDGDVITACQAACPTQAIEFGNIEDSESAVSKKRKSGRSYGMLSQLNVKPRTEYLARVRNPHKRLMTSAQLHDLETITAPHHAHGHGDHEGDHEGDAHAGDAHAGDAHGGDEPGHDDHQKKSESAAAE